VPDGNAPEAEGKVITFYSYKGGTGRTMALANVGWILASNGYRVLVVDWDLDSPGLHKYLRPFIDPAKITATPGVIELIKDYMYAATQAEESGPNWHLEYARIEPHALSVNWQNFPNGGTLDFVSAGQQNRDFSSAVTSIDWNTFFERFGGGQFFDALRADMKSNYDYTLIDSRTGLSDIADICTQLLPDTLVDCFTLSDQSIEGAAAVARNVAERFHYRNIRVLPVLMRIDDSEKAKLDVGRVIARDQFAGFPAGMDPDEVDRYWSSVEIPYQAFYAFEEMLAVFGDKPGSPLTLLAAFERLTGAITQGEVTSLRPMAEETRREFEEAFTRHRPPSQGEIYVSYVPDDRMWADWIAAVLTAAGLRVRPLENVTGAGNFARLEAMAEAQAATRTIAVLSAAYLRSPQASGVWEALGTIDPSGTSRRLIPVRVDETPLRGAASERQVVDLTRRDDDQAAEDLLRVFGQSHRWRDIAVDATSLGVRYPRTSPTVWQVRGRNATFSGRNQVLEDLRATLRGSGKAVVLPVALYGLGGVGKTQLALEYAHRYMADYDLVWWISAEQRELINSEFARLAEPLGIRIGDNIAEAVNDVRNALRRGMPYSKWLLIFDNADDPAEVADFIPGGPGHVLVTSRNPSWSQLATPVEVDVFHREESLEFLQRRVPSLTAEDAYLVADRLGDLPLAIDQAAGWLAATGMTAADYAAELEAQFTATSGHSRENDLPTEVLVPFRLSFDRLRERSPAAARLLEICSFFAPEPIALPLLYSDATLAALTPADPHLQDRILLGGLIRDIARYSLARVDRGEDTLQVHRLIQAAVRGQIPSQAGEDTMHVVHEILSAARPPGNIDDPGNWKQYDLIWKHLAPSEADDCDYVPTRQLVIDRVRYDWSRGDYDTAWDVGSRLYEKWSVKLGPDDRQTLAVRFHLGNVLRSQGRFEDALAMNTGTFERRRTVLGENHPHTLQTAGSMAADLRALGRFYDALDMDTRTYRQFVDVLGEDEPSTLSAANNLAVDLRLVGNALRALHLDEDTYARRERVLGAEHPYTLHSGTMLAQDMRETGDFTHSLELLNDLYQRYCSVLDKDSVHTLRTAKSLAVSLRKVGRLEEAHRLTLDTLQRYEMSKASTHPNALACRLNHACELSAMDDKAAANDVASKVRDAYRDTLGDGHPFTLITQSNISTYLRGLGRRTEALELMDQTLSALITALGADHPVTLSCAVNKANCLNDAELFDEAETLLRDTLERLQGTLGERHPDTHVCTANLAVTLQSQGKTDDALKIQARALAAMQSGLDNEHPNISSLRDWQLQSRDLEVPPT
jgi:MinD-like ATPase involved in chromosome partitioning or flagellar assembly/tetratricopeptide (TPR) repeat protein